MKLEPMRLLLQTPVDTRRLATIEITDRDGSVIVAFPREGSSEFSNESTSEPTSKIEEKRFEKPRSKTKKITLHPTGRVNFHHQNSQIYVERLYKITTPVWLFLYRYPGWERPDVIESAQVQDDDVLWDVGNVLMGDPVSIQLTVGPAIGRGQTEDSLVLTIHDRVSLSFQRVGSEELCGQSSLGTS
jgi:hypothetical protein